MTTLLQTNDVSEGLCEQKVPRRELSEGRGTAKNRRSAEIEGGGETNTMIWSPAVLVSYTLRSGCVCHLLRYHHC